MVDSNSLEKIFISFAGGKKEMANKEFAKLNKDCGLLDKAYTSTDVDLVFSKCKAKTAKVLTYGDFQSALEQIAAKKKVTKDAIVEKIVKSGGPHFQGTKADYVKFHDDKSLYTGVYAKGGPSTVDISSGKVSDISQICDRTGADARGVKK